MVVLIVMGVDCSYVVRHRVAAWTGLDHCVRPFFGLIADLHGGYAYYIVRRD